MAEIPANVVTDPQAELAVWYTLKQEAAAAILRERTMRARLFAHFFPAPVEGTNTFVLPDGFQLKGKYPISREIDAGALQGLRDATVGGMREQLKALNLDVSAHADDVPVVVALGISLDKLTKWTPDLVVKEYRTLTAEQRYILDMCMVIKPGSPAMEVVPPSTKGAKAVGVQAA